MMYFEFWNGGHLGRPDLALLTIYLSCHSLDFVVEITTSENGGVTDNW